MYELISRVATRLLSLRSIEPPLLHDIADLISDDDYRDHFLELVALHYLKNGLQSETESFVKALAGLETSRILSRLGQAALGSGNQCYAVTLFSQAMAATEANRFPTEKSIAVLEIAQALQAGGLNLEAVAAFGKAIAIAIPAQKAEGTAGLEANGVIFSAVKGLNELGAAELAISKAGLIAVPALRKQAEQILGRTLD